MTMTDDGDTIAISSTLHHSLGVRMLDLFFEIDRIGSTHLQPSNWIRDLYRDPVYEPRVAERLGEWWCLHPDARDDTWDSERASDRLWEDVLGALPNWDLFLPGENRRTIYQALRPIALTAMRDIVQGRQVTILTDRPYAAPLHPGDVVEVVRVDEHVLVVVTGGGNPWNVPWTAVNLSTVESPEPATSADGDAAVIESLRSDVQRLQNLLDEANAGQARYVERVRQDVDRLNEILAQKASENDFCSVWDETIDEVNGGNTYVLLKDREVDYAATRTVEIVVRVMQSGSYTGRENNDLDEDDFSWSDVETDDILAAVRRGDWRDPENDAEDFEYEAV